MMPNDPNFSIREHVFKSRSKNLSKNWPFSDKHLQFFMENGIQNPLPPFGAEDSSIPYPINDLPSMKCKEVRGPDSDDDGMNTTLNSYFEKCLSLKESVKGSSSVADQAVEHSKEAGKDEKKNADYDTKMTLQSMLESLGHWPNAKRAASSSSAAPRVSRRKSSRPKRYVA